VKVAKSRGLRILAFTDHEDVRGYWEALDYSRELGVVLIPGMEVTLREAHVLLLGVDPRNPPQLPENTDIAEFLDRIHSENIVTVLAHPFSRAGIFAYPVVKRVDVLRKFDLVEVLNGKSLMISNARANELARRIGRPGVAGSDAHVAMYVGAVRTIVEAEFVPEDVDEVLEGLRRGRVSVEGRTSLMQIAKHYVQELLCLLGF